MDRNLLIACVLSFLVLSLWSLSQNPPPKPQQAPASEVVAQSAERAESAGPTPAAPPAPRPAAPDAAERYPELPSAGGGAPALERTPARAALPSGDAIRIERDRYVAELDSAGATLRSWKLQDFHDRHGDPIHLVRRGDVEPTLATPFFELDRGDLSRELWRVVRSDGATVEFALERDGVTLRKRYDFGDGAYDLRLYLEVYNGSDAAIAPAFLVDWPIQERPGNDFREQTAATLHVGELESTLLASIGSAGITGWFSGARGGEPELFQGEIDWAGVNTPYFLGALFPDQPAAARARFVTVEKGRRGAVQLYFDPVSLPPGQRASREYRAYLGPKQPEHLEALAPSAIESIDLGFSVIAPMTRAFGWMLAVLYSFVPNYGLAIILLTILVRVATAPLTIKQMKSMERMRRIQPKIKALQEKFADDRQKQSEAMMSLYRQEKVNPLGGCLPMLLQLPVFIGLFYALRSSIQLRQAPFFGWIDDLSAPDTLFMLPGFEFPVRVLPILMGASMFAQQKITPMQMDPAQARMMLILMPTMMTVISYTFPSGLVLYWMMSNVLAISHQLWIGRNIESPSKS